MEFQNKTVMITGAFVGIGKATAIQFAKHEANVCIVDINTAGLDTLTKEIELIGANVTSYICDVSDEQQVLETTQKIIKKYGKINILINNAGLWRMFKPFVETTSDEWKTLLNVNVLGLMYFTNAVLSNMMKNA